MAQKKFSVKPKSGGRFNVPDVAAPNPDSFKPTFSLSLMRGEGCVSACNKDEQALAVIGLQDPDHDSHDETTYNETP